MELNEAEILVVDDERVLRLSLASLLTAKGASVRSARSGREALTLYHKKRPDLVLLDVMMPGMDGFEVAQAIREMDQTMPILFLTAMEGEKNEVLALRLGADGYIGKSASEALLLARVMALLRPRPASRPPSGPRGVLCVQPDEMRLQDTTGRWSVLTVREMELIKLFLASPNKIFSRDYLIGRFWPGEESAADHALTMTIVRLREKMGVDGERLQSLRGLGYSLRMD